MTLNVYEMYRSIQGESSYVGLPCSFVRLAGCNLRCRYCDTRYAQSPGEAVSIESIVEQMDAFGLRLVEITGGEPLIQEETPLLISMLLNKNYTVLVETNGSCDISLIPAGAVAIMDIKTPASGESERMMWENIWKLKPTDEVKFVISDRHDYEWSVGIIHERFGRTKTEILLSAVFGELPPGQLVKWMLADKVPARFNLQIHKYIWPHDRGGV